MVWVLVTAQSLPRWTPMRGLPKVFARMRAALIQWVKRIAARPALDANAMTYDEVCPWTMPSTEALPFDSAGLLEIGKFILHYDPTRHFRERWGDDYRAKIEALWNSCVAAYRDGRTPNHPADELLLCLTRDWILGPYLGVPQGEKLRFLRWLLIHVRVKLAADKAARGSR
jgi:hypothetical protein